MRVYILLGAVLLIGGFLVFTAPEALWYLEEGWKHKNAEPSDIALLMNKIGGVVGALVGVGMIIYGLAGSFSELMPGNELRGVMKVNNIDTVKVTSALEEVIFLGEEEIKEVVEIIREADLKELNTNVFAGTASRRIDSVEIKFENGEGLIARGYINVFLTRFNNTTYTFNADELESYLESCF